MRNRHDTNGVPVHFAAVFSEPVTGFATADVTVGGTATGKSITSVTDSGDQIWIAEYDLSRRFNTRGIKQEDNSYRLEFQHDLRFGGTSAPAKQAIEGNCEFICGETLATRLVFEAVPGIAGAEAEFGEEKVTLYVRKIGGTVATA